MMEQIKEHLPFLEAIAIYIVLPLIGVWIQRTIKRLSRNITKIEELTNGRITQLLETTAQLAKAIGKEEERVEQRLRETLNKEKKSNE